MTNVRRYFALTFLISWGGILLAIGGPGAIPGGAQARNDPRFPLVYLAMLAGPVIASLVAIGSAGGRHGYRALWARFTTWRVPIHWYAVAVFTAPIVVGLVVTALSFADPGYSFGVMSAQDKTATIVFGLAVGLGAGALEELGWTGFAIPELRRRYGILTTGLAVGVLWAGWHVLAVLWGIGDLAGDVPLGVFVSLDLLTVLPAYRVLMVWVYDRTSSLLVSMLMHASLTSTLLILGPSVTGGRLLAYDAAIALCLWVAAAAALRSVGRTHAAGPHRHDDADLVRADARRLR